MLGRLEKEALGKAALPSWTQKHCLFILSELLLVTGQWQAPGLLPAEECRGEQHPVLRLNHNTCAPVTSVLTPEARAQVQPGAADKERQGGRENLTT